MELENQRLEHAKEIQEQRLTARDENRQLEKTIVVLRGKLEQVNAR
jgi:small-conductance mechanosensitive channel